jgi:hypothetical protein
MTFHSSSHHSFNSDRNKAGGSLPETSIFVIHMKAYSVQLVDRIYAKDLRNAHQQEQIKGVEKLLNGKPLLEQNRRLQEIETGGNVGTAVKTGEVEILKCDATLRTQSHQSIQKLIEISGKQGPETIIGADFLEPRVLKLDEATSAGICLGAGHVTRSVVGVVEPVSMHVADVTVQFLGLIVMAV